MATQSISLKRTGGVLPDGFYRLIIDTMELKQGAKAPYFAMKLRVQGKTTVIYENLSLAEAARFRLEAFLDAIQAPTTGAMTPAKLVQFCRNKSFIASVSNESYNGRLKNVVENFLLPEVEDQLDVESGEKEEEEDEDTQEDEEDWGESDGDDDDDGDQPALPF